ncbi:phage integrase N-terminal SAM-like domain-containing protein [Paraglaciecola sp. L3A3]
MSGKIPRSCCYTKRTIESYLKWISSFIHFHQKKTPKFNARY